MASVHEIGIAAETRAFEDNIKSGVIKPVENAVDAFKDLEDAASDAGKDGARGLDKLEDELKDVQRQSEKTERATKDIGDTGAKSFSHIKEGAQELTQEVGQNLGETVSSIRGDFSDLGQVGQDTLGGLAATVAGMGPAGLVGALALAAGAIGLGAVSAGFDDLSAKQERLKEQSAEWAQAYMEAGSSILSTSQIIAKGQEIFGDPEKYAEATENAKNWGVEVSTAVAAMAGSQTAIDAVSRALGKQADALKANSEGADGYAQNIEQATTGQSKANDAYLKGKAAFDDLNGAMRIGRDTAGYMSQMLVDLAKNTDGVTSKVDEFGDTVYNLPDGTTVYVDAETGQATTDLDAIDKKIYSTNGKTATVEVVVDDTAVKNWRAPMLPAMVLELVTPRADLGRRMP